MQWMRFLSSIFLLTILACDVSVSGLPAASTTASPGGTLIPPSTFVAPPSFTATAASAQPSPTAPAAPSSTRAPSSTLTFTPLATTSTGAGSCQPSGNDGFEDQLIALMNQERAGRGLETLEEQPQLTAAARSHSADMACRNYFSHTGLDGSSPFDRMARAGYVFSAAAENLAAGHASPQAAFDGWMDSPGHRDNLLNPDYVHVGVGYAFHPGSQYGSYWTATYGAP
jgi:uncharacterized protein YkwD